MSKYKKRSAPSAKKLYANDYCMIWSVMAINIIALAVFYVYTNFSSIFMAFEEETETGIKYSFFNFKYIFDEIANPVSQIRISIKNTLTFFVVSLLITMPLTYITAFFIYKKVPGYKVHQFIFFLPAVVSPVIMTSFFKFFLYPDGPVSQLWSIIFGTKAPIFFANSDWAMKVIVFYVVWSSIGPGILMYVASMTRIPEAILESAKMEGVTFWQEVIYFIIPLTWPFVSTMLFLSLCGIMSASGPILLFTQGAANTSDLGYWMYINTVAEAQQPRAAALGLLMTAVNMPIALTFRKLANKVEDVTY